MGQCLSQVIIHDRETTDGHREEFTLVENRLRERGLPAHLIFSCELVEFDDPVVRYARVRIVNRPSRHTQGYGREITPSWASFLGKRLTYKSQTRY